MALSREQVVEAAMTILRSYGLSSLSMRNLAKDLGVQPGALYWHVKSKQDLLVLLAEQILAPAMNPAEASGAPGPRSGGADTRLGEADTREVALQLRDALTAVKDGAEVVSVAHALDPRALAPLRRVRETLPAGLTPRQAEWGARALIHYILGAVAEEQNHVALTLAGVATADQSTAYTTEAFLFGVDALVGGLTAAARAESGSVVVP